MKQIYLSCLHTPKKIYSTTGSTLQKPLLVLFLSLFFLLPAKLFASVTSITINSIQDATNTTPISTFYPGQSFTITFSSVASATNIYTVELSDSTGSFPGTAIGIGTYSVSGSVSSKALACTIPVSTLLLHTLPNSNFKIRVTNNTSPSVVGGPNSITITSGGFCIGLTKIGGTLGSITLTPAMCGTTFYDNGGPSYNYITLKTTNSNVSTFGSITKLAINPPDPSWKVKLTFTSFGVNSDYDDYDDDYVSIYNDNSATTDIVDLFGLQSNGSLQGNPGPYTSTDASGALTVVLTDDGSTVATTTPSTSPTGWVATVQFIIPAPTGSSTQSVCPGATLADLSVSITPGAGINWYTLSSGGTLLPGNTTPVSGTTYYAAQTAGSCESTSRLAVTVTVKTQWLGITGSWNVGSNWCTGIVPDSTTDVVITGGVPAAPTVNGNAYCHNLTIQSSGAVTVTSFNDLAIYGNFSKAGTFTATAPGATVELKGSANQSIDAITANTVNVNTNFTVTLNATLTVTNLLTLTKGIISTGSNSVTVSNSAATSIDTGTGNTNYAKGWINGTLVRSFPTSSSTGTYDFPVGNATYGRLEEIKSHSLVGITSFTAYCRALANGNNSQMDAWETSIPGTPYHTPYTSMNTGGTWVLEPNSQPTSGTYDIAVFFKGFTNLADNEFGILKRPVDSVTFYAFKTGGGTLKATNGNGRKVTDGYALRSGLATFSEFGIGQTGSILPIQLVSFTTELCDDNKDALLKWNTASELNNDHFDIEAGTQPAGIEDIAFNKIGEVKGAGTSTIENNYSFIDYSPNKSGTWYYRLGQVDADGNKTYSNINALAFNNPSVNTISVYPNPNNGLFTIASTGTLSGNVTLEITNLLGQQVLFKTFNLNQTPLNEQVALPENAPAGIYFIKAQINNAPYYISRVNVLK